MSIRGVEVDVRKHSAAIRGAYWYSCEIAADNCCWCGNGMVAIASARCIIAENLVELTRAHSKGLLDGVLHSHIPIYFQIKICSKLGYELVVIQIMNQHSRLRVKHISTVPTLIVGLGILADPEQVSDFIMPPCCNIWYS